tara:strand:- start:1036 stop:1626 length:591 start_codon:yes stop_codon:yes gene_type:complete
MATTRPNRSIADFKGKLTGGGARPNLFEVTIPKLPTGITWDGDTFRYMCKAASLPASTIANIDVPFRGRIFKVAGDRTVDVWSITVINDEDFKLRNAFEEWMDLIAKLDNNLGATTPDSYMVDAEVFQLGRGGKINSSGNGGNNNAVLKQYKFQSIFPTSLSAIDLSYDTGDTIEEFTVEFQVQSFEYAGAGGPNA